MIKALANLLGAPAASSLPIQKQLPTIAAIFVSLLLVTLFSTWLGAWFLPSAMPMILVASMGASVILLFIIPNSPLIQPYALVMGHVVPASIGVACAYLAEHLQLPLFFSTAFCVGVSVLAMLFLNCLHPPGGAAALPPILSGSAAVGGIDYILVPVLLNALLLLVLGILFHRYWLKAEYPIQPLAKEDTVHHNKDASPLARLGITGDDLDTALGDFNAYLNISEKDLAEIFGRAQQNAYTRKFGEIRCRDIMTRDVKSVEYGTELEDAWALLRFHKIKLLPVIDEGDCVIGIISLVDYLKRANLKTYEGFAERLVSFVKRTPGLQANKPEYVGHIMAAPAFTVNEDELIATLVPLLSDKGFHHIPVVNNRQRLVGMVTQSDLIAALYSGSVSSVVGS
jgi:CBS domain-containing membrane protein